MSAAIPFEKPKKLNPIPVRMSFNQREALNQYFQQINSTESLSNFFCRLAMEEVQRHNERQKLLTD